MVIIDKNKLKGKVDNFIKENHINMLNKDPTEVKIETCRSTFKYFYVF